MSIVLIVIIVIVVLNIWVSFGTKRTYKGGSQTRDPINSPWDSQSQSYINSNHHNDYSNYNDSSNCNDYGGGYSDGGYCD